MMLTGKLACLWFSYQHNSKREKKKKKNTQLMMLTGQLGSQCSMAQKSTGILKETDFVGKQTLLSIS